jgi:hypothetical protein
MTFNGLLKGESENQKAVARLQDGSDGSVSTSKPLKRYE